MNSVIEQVEAFRRYVLEHAKGDAADLSLDDLFAHWSGLNRSAQELEQSRQSLNRGLADADAGLLVDASQAIPETRARLIRIA